jgi:hypothetical protein
MNVDTSATRRPQKFFGKDTPVSDHYRDVRLVRRKQLFRLVVLDSRGLKHTETL